jgi:hypothetical protein
MVSSAFLYKNKSKVETPIHDSIRELVTWECKEHGVKSRMCQQMRKEVLGLNFWRLEQFYTNL